MILLIKFLGPFSTWKFRKTVIDRFRFSRINVKSISKRILLSKGRIYLRKRRAKFYESSKWFFLLNYWIVSSTCKLSKYFRFSSINASISAFKLSKRRIHLRKDEILILFLSGNRREENGSRIVACPSPNAPRGRRFFRI